MPGAYAHITLVNHLRVPEYLESIADFPTEAITSVMDYFKFCELGVVSPDYPYLAIGDNNSAKWADLMHYENTGQMIKSGIKNIQGMQGEDKKKAFAWLVGYASHVATDVTIHPVVELKVGTYADNKTDHRICEMNQDAYIFQRLNLGQIGLSDHLKWGIGDCCSQHDKEELDPVILKLWSTMFKESHPDKFKDNLPDINKWHGCFEPIVDNISAVGNKLIPFARHVGVDCGLLYPQISEIDDQYIKSIKVPSGSMNYDQVFDKAVESVKKVWSIIAKGVFEDDRSYLSKIGNWNLDTGKDDQGRMVFWS